MTRKELRKQKEIVESDNGYMLMVACILVLLVICSIFTYCIYINIARLLDWNTNGLVHYTGSIEEYYIKDYKHGPDPVFFKLNNNVIVRIPDVLLHDFGYDESKMPDDLVFYYTPYSLQRKYTEMFGEYPLQYHNLASVSEQGYNEQMATKMKAELHDNIKGYSFTLALFLVGLIFFVYLFVSEIYEDAKSRKKLEKKRTTQNRTPTEISRRT